MGLGQSQIKLGHRFHARPILGVWLAKVDEGEAVPGGDDDAIMMAIIMMKKVMNIWRV